MSYKRRRTIFTVLLFVSLVFIWGMFPSAPAEGMYPLSEIPKNDLTKAGLKINPDEIFNPDGVSYIDALVKLGGCTGSFVSRDGLIITNHHCAFRAVNKASTTEHNYLRDGFLANEKEEEIPAEGYACRIADSYEDVSEEVLAAAEGIDDLTERNQAIRDKMAELAADASDSENSIEAQVSEMFVGKTYVLFKYRIIKDVRLVYVPPRSVGEFGGETDNWIWPRHTGDFSFVRAYVAPDGSAAEYSKENVPYHPKKFLRINPKGVQEGDFVFILGYPGRTFRHMPARFVEYQEKIQLPYISQLFEWMIDEMEALSKEDEALQLEYASQIKGLANTMKNYKGKLRGLKRLQLVRQKFDEENKLKEFIESDKSLKEKYGSLFDEINGLYDEQFEIGKAYLWLRMFTRFSDVYRLAQTFQSYREKFEAEEPDSASGNLNELKETLIGLIEKSDGNFDKAFVTKMFYDAGKFGEERKINAAELLNGKTAEEFAEELFSSKLLDKDFIENELCASVESVKNFDDILTRTAKSVFNQTLELTAKTKELSGVRTDLLAKFVNAKMAWKKQSFIPDANGTLRLTYGYVKGYYPADAVYYSPITSLSGVIDKSMLGGEYAIPDKLKTLYDNKEFGEFYNDELGGVPVAILYDTDTTGGNSGSPILNAYGELIGVNFDRAYEATINDYQWDESYSRSIGVDIRYVLWIAKYLSGADNLLKEITEKI
ncbi:MAG: S46 family peptidase [Chlorobi bacterium]|nr:S46 family peptidase [Chlorobiota bacterium]